MSETASDIDRALRLHRAGDLDGAINLYRAMVDDDPENADAWHLMGVAVHQKGNQSLAADLIEAAISLDDTTPDFFSNLGMVKRAAEDDSGAEDAFRRAIEIDPFHARAHSNLAGLLRSSGKFDAALIAAKLAVEYGAEDAEAHNNLGNTLKDCGATEAAVGAYRQAIKLSPDFALAHWNLALALGSLGQLQEGFTEMAWRWQWSGFPAPLREFPAAVWRGEKIEGARILLHAEQGLGDAIHFIRYAPLVRDLGATVIVECPGELVPLAARAGLADHFVAAGDDLPSFDTHAPFVDVPAILKTSLDTIPDQIPYLAVDDNRLAAWRTGIADLKGLKVGLNWLGNIASPVERFRCLPLAGLGPLGDIAGITWVSLQKGPGGADTPKPDGLDLVETGEAPLGDTAALIKNLDLVITSDTAVAHLAGALGVPTWLLLHHAPDWRWMLGRADSPWYPSIKLYRQTDAGDWTPVIAAAAADLSKLAKG
ncbi:MAG: glycosyltransferase family protein [Rhodospirillales bacterium]|nr:glycosyltransferase family protein [Rhodospirillales bacterium]